MSEEDEIAAWLRAQAEGDNEAARGGEAYYCEGCRVLHDPSAEAQDEAARAQSVLAVLDDYETMRKLAEAAWEQEAGAHSLYDQARTLKWTVRKLAHGYRFREGYEAEEWKP